MGKRGGHATNYYGKAITVARHLQVPVNLIEKFQNAYLGAFPGIPRWWTAIQQQLQEKGWIETPFGRVRQFFGRRHDDATLREAIAFNPQST